MRSFLINLKSSLWFIPSLCVMFSAGLAVALVQLDAALTIEFSRLSPEFFGLGADGSRDILATIAQSVITLAGVSFSITIVALSLAANQYTPRVLRNFMRDRGNQAVLGGLVGIFTYCIIVLRTIQGGEESFVPAIAVIVALGFSLVAIGLFIYFVHHVATSIQASSIISSIALETQEVFRTLFPEFVEQDRPEFDDTQVLVWHSVAAPKTGYLQTMDVEALSAMAGEQRVVFQVLASIGEFVVQDTPLLQGSWRAAPDKDAVEELQRCFHIHPFRTIDEDPAFGMRQIVDIAVKALSPGINDPTTAITCLNYLGAILNIISERDTPPPCRAVDGKVCLVLQPLSFDFLVDLAFGEVRQNCQKQPVVYGAIFQAMVNAVKGRKISSARRVVFARHANLVLQSAERNLLFPPDLKSVQEEGRKAFAILDAVELGGRGEAQSSSTTQS